jgi:hypothetical protein
MMHALVAENNLPGLMLVMVGAMTCLSPTSGKRTILIKQRCLKSGLDAVTQPPNLPHAPLMRCTLTWYSYSLQTPPPNANFVAPPHSGSESCDGPRMRGVGRKPATTCVKVRRCPEVNPACGTCCVRTPLILTCKLQYTNGCAWLFNENVKNDGGFDTRLVYKLLKIMA